MSKLPLSHISWLLPGVVGLSGSEAQLSTTLERSGISPSLVGQQDGWITKSQLYRFYDEAARGPGGPDFGFVAGEFVSAERLGLVGASMASATTFGEALRIFCRLTPRHVESISLWVEEDATDSALAWLCTKTEDWIPGMSDTAEHVALAALINVIRIVGGSQWRPRRARLQAAPNPDAERHPLLSACELHHYQPYKAVAFPSAFLSCSLPDRKTANGSDPSHLLPSNDATMSRRIELLGLSMMQAGEPIPTSSEFAGLAGFSPRTLHRHLAAEGVTVREIVDRIRLKRSLQLLRISGISIKEIASELGYSGPNNFIRAFRRQIGLTPGEYREGTVESAS